MKKILMTLAAVAMAATMNAQGYIGGTMGIGSLKVGDADAETSYKFLPEIGYNINSDCHDNRHNHDRASGCAAER